MKPYRYKVRYYNMIEAPQLGGVWGVQVLYRKSRGEGRGHSSKKTKLVFTGTWRECIDYVNMSIKFWF